MMTGLPDGSKTFKPQPFVKDSRAKLVSLGKKMIKNYGSTFPGCKREWSDWVDNIAPQSDDACEYIKVRLLVLSSNDFLILLRRTHYIFHFGMSSSVEVQSTLRYL
jgi:hypothetical protein